MASQSGSLDLPTFKSPRADRSPRSAVSPAPPESPATASGSPADSANLPLLPKSKRPSFSSHRNDANASLALDLLADVETAIAAWHQNLRQTLVNIQALYTAGPIVDGWLEAVPATATPTTGNTASVLRHGDANQVAAYVERLSHSPAAGTVQGTQYRLCRLDADGQMQCQLCPPDQLGAISQAIARHQQLRQLVSQKQYLEARLKRAAEALEVTRQTLGIGSRTAAD